MEFSKHGLLGYATTVATHTAAFLGTGAAVGASAFNPVNLVNPVEWSLRAMSPNYWCAAVQYGASTWGNLAATPVACVSAAALGLLRFPAIWLRAACEEYDRNEEGPCGTDPHSPIVPVGAQPVPEPVELPESPESPRPAPVGGRPSPWRQMG